MKPIAAAVIAVTVLCLGTLAALAQGGNYAISPGDSLRVEVLEDSSLNRNVLVLPDGRISFPLAGSVRAAGLSVGQVERSIASRIAPNFANPPKVFVSVVGIPEREGPAEIEPDTLLVYMVGEVGQPGPKAVLPGTTILQLLAQSGGFTRFAATNRLQLRRKDDHSGREKLYTIDYRAISRGASLTSDLVLREGDVLLVPERRLFE